jgi:hypothetical protein
LNQQAPPAGIEAHAQERHIAFADVPTVRNAKRKFFEPQPNCPILSLGHSLNDLAIAQIQLGGCVRLNPQGASLEMNGRRSRNAKDIFRA